MVQLSNPFSPSLTTVLDQRIISRSNAVVLRACKQLIQWCKISHYFMQNMDFIQSFQKDPDCDWHFARLKILVITFLSDFKLTVSLP
jgi:hypothetical protein